jgi:hypothetical protein
MDTPRSNDATRWSKIKLVPRSMWRQARTQRRERKKDSDALRNPTMHHRRWLFSAKSSYLYVWEFSSFYSKTLLLEPLFKKCLFASNSHKFVRCPETEVRPLWFLLHSGLWRRKYNQHWRVGKSGQLRRTQKTVYRKRKKGKSYYRSSLYQMRTCSSLRVRVTSCPIQIPPSLFYLLKAILLYFLYPCHGRTRRACIYYLPWETTTWVNALCPTCAELTSSYVFCHNQ